jgi:hypothetical protein
MSNGLIVLSLLCSSSFSGMPRTLKSFKLLPFWLLDSASGLHGWLKQKDIFFWGNELSPCRLLRL